MTGDPHSPPNRSSDRYVLLVLGDDQAQCASFPLPERGSVTIGRSHKCDIRIDDPSMSRQHAVLHIGKTISIEDLGSANGTRVRDARLVYASSMDSAETVELQDRPVPSNQAMEVSPGDVIELGTAVVVVQHAVSEGRPRRLWAHGYFEARLEEECARADRSRSSFAVFRIHAGENASAEAIERSLAAATRSVDVVAAYGPGEYEVLAIDVDPERASTLRSRVMSELEARGLRPKVGMACFPSDGRNPDRLIARACERALGERPQAEGPLVIVDPAMQRLYRLAERVADSKICVLLLGETGVGKEVLAETIHKYSPRCRTTMLRINCAALSESLLESELFGHERGAFTGAAAAKQGLLESAHGGTVFLDEIGELPLPTQAKLLRVFEGDEVMRVGAVKPRRIDVRFIAATNRDLEEGTRRGTFREDLYFRLSGVSLIIPPLRERRAEIEPLARRFVRQFARGGAQDISPQALAWLERYSWPGNVRELRNVIERAMLLAGDGLILIEHLPVEKMGATLPTAPPSGPPSFPPPPPFVVPPPPAAAVASDRTPEGLRQQLEVAERNRVLQALDACAGNQTRAAKMLGISRRTLVSRLDTYGIARPRKATTGEE